MNLYELIYHIRNLDIGIGFAESKSIFMNYKSEVVNPAPLKVKCMQKKKKPHKAHHLNMRIWKPIRKVIIEKYGTTCMRCKVNPSLARDAHVDHIKPKSKYPDLKYDKSNLQILCKKCNFEKGNVSETDYRPN
jgi:5-methylcytosine-specific restriction endonuclease McrA